MKNYSTAGKEPGLECCYRMLKQVTSHHWQLVHPILTSGAGLVRTQVVESTFWRTFAKKKKISQLLPFTVSSGRCIHSTWHSLHPSATVSRYSRAGKMAEPEQPVSDHPDQDHSDFDHSSHSRSSQPTSGRSKSARSKKDDSESAESDGTPPDVQIIRYRVNRRRRTDLHRPRIEYVFTDGTRYHEPPTGEEDGVVEVHMEPEAGGDVWMSQSRVGLMSPRGLVLPQGVEEPYHHILLHVPGHTPRDVWKISAGQWPTTSQHRGKSFPDQPRIRQPRQVQASPGQSSREESSPEESSPEQASQEQAFPGQILPGQHCRGQALSSQAFPNRPLSNHTPPSYRLQDHPILGQYGHGEPPLYQSLPPQNPPQFPAQTLHSRQHSAQSQQLSEGPSSSDLSQQPQVGPITPFSLSSNNMADEEQVRRFSFQSGMGPDHEAAFQQGDESLSSPQDQCAGNQQTDGSLFLPQPDQVYYQQNGQAQYPSQGHQVAYQQDNSTSTSSQAPQLVYQPGNDFLGFGQAPQVAYHQGNDPPAYTLALDQFQQGWDFTQDQQPSVIGAANYPNNFGAANFALLPDGRLS